ncbi:hypothetical protein [Alicyclobacillus fodiniaquatilis]|uniref:AAA domain-containing protein n=1 Tax=Alicyclobacillus fodiniaquatilis TaxID=1661150 RepID=A0ABW4JI72_9BACL
MRKLWIGTGIEGFDRIINDKFSDEFEPFIVSYAMGFEMIHGQHGDVAIISEMLGTENALGLEPNVVYLRVINHLRKQGVRVCFFGTETDQDKDFIKELVSRGVYDILFSDDMSYGEVFHLVEAPNSYAEVSHWFDNAKSPQNQTRKRISLSLHEHVEEVEEITEKQKVSTQNKSFFSWSNKRKTRDSNEVSVNKIQPKIILVSGLPGTGSSFISLNLAVSLSSKYNTAFVEASERPILSSWMGWSGGEDSVIKLAKGQPVERRRMISESLRAYNADQDLDTSIINVEALIQASRRLEYDYIIIDIPFVQFVKIKADYKVLVSNSDLAKCRRVSSVKSSLVVLNMTPKRLPVDLAEYQSFWPNTPLVTCPFLEDQSLSIVLGRPLSLRVNSEKEKFQRWLSSMSISI